MNPFHVCIVDDDPMARMVAADALGGRDYQISECATGAACLALFAAGDPFDFDATPVAPPDVVLLDIEMPEMDGYEVCRRLREGGHDGTQVIFVSGRDDLESRLASFDAGGSDFIVKPYAPKELQHHVAKVEQLALRQREHAEMLSYAQKTAFSAMSSMGEMGAVLQFMRDSFACQDAAALAERIIEAHRAYGLAVLVGLRVGDSDTYASS
jgi:DNA-binding response OmpR family regulator